MQDYCSIVWIRNFYELYALVFIFLEMHIGEKKLLERKLTCQVEIIVK